MVIIILPNRKPNNNFMENVNNGKIDHIAMNDSFKKYSSRKQDSS